MFEPGRRLTPGMLEALRQASRELHQRHGLRGVHYETGQAKRQQLERASDAPSVAPAI
jgi:hypothetical protein